MVRELGQPGRRWQSRRRLHRRRLDRGPPTVRRAGIRRPWSCCSTAWKARRPAVTRARSWRPWTSAAGTAACPTSAAARARSTGPARLSFRATARVAWILERLSARARRRASTLPACRWAATRCSEMGGRARRGRRAASRGIAAVCSPRIWRHAAAPVCAGFSMLYARMFLATLRRRARKARAVSRPGLRRPRLREARDPVIDNPSPPAARLSRHRRLLGARLGKETALGRYPRPRWPSTRATIAFVPAASLPHRSAVSALGVAGAAEPTTSAFRPPAGRRPRDRLAPTGSCTATV